MKANLTDVSENQKSEGKQCQTTKITTSDSVCPLCNGTGFVIEWQEDEKGNKVEYAKRCQCQATEEKTRLKSKSGIPAEYEACTVAGFDTSLYQDTETAKKIKHAAAEYIKHFQQFREQGKGLYFYSQTKGSGKTRLACSLGNAIIATNAMKVSYIKTIDLLSTIRDTYNKKEPDITEKELIDGIKKTPFLIIDDIGAEKPNDFVNSVFLNILDYRISHLLVTVFTSNVPQNGLKLDERIADRICKMSIEIHFPEESIRRKKANAECTELLKILGI